MSEKHNSKRNLAMERTQAISLRDLLNEIKTVLLSDSPDVRDIQTRFENELGVSAESVQDLIYQVVMKINKNIFPPVTDLELILTDQCNLACKYCFEKNIQGYQKMSWDIARGAIDLLFDYSQNENQLAITYIGGEPTLNFSIIKHITEYAEQKSSSVGKSINFNMTSNGVLLNNGMVDYFARHKIKILLSVDGLESTHNRFRIDKRGNGTFERVMRSFKLLKMVQPWIGIKMTIMPENASSLFGDVIGLYEIGVNQFLIGYAHGVNWLESDIKIYIDQLCKLYRWYKKKPRQDLRIITFEKSEESSSYFGCLAGRNNIAVSVNGEVSACTKIYALDDKSLLAKLGCVKYGLTHLKNRRELVCCSRLRSACKKLGINEEFRGGCFASNYEENHDLFEPSMQQHSFSLLERSIAN